MFSGINVRKSYTLQYYSFYLHTTGHTFRVMMKMEMDRKKIILKKIRIRI